MTGKEQYKNWLEEEYISPSTGRKLTAIDQYINGVKLVANSLDIEPENLFEEEDIQTLKGWGEDFRNSNSWQKDYSSHFNLFIKYKSISAGDFEESLEDEQESRTEGGQRVIISKIAERKKSLRDAAIKQHGSICFGCNFDFEKKYGVQGVGFIEIHHIKPLRDGEEFNIRETNVATDLIPLCSNCHRMVHRKRNVVLSLDELKAIIKK